MQRSRSARRLWRLEGFEADDLIATYARAAAAKGAKVTIVSSDKDLMQLVSDEICLLDTVKDKKICAPEVFEKFGVTPDRVIDVQALCGDSVDNVPGVPGIGIKTAAQLIQEYGDLDTLLERAGEIKQPKRKQSLIDHADMARLSRTLVTLRDDVPMPEPLEALGVRDPDPAVLLPFLEDMGFRTLTRRVTEQFGAAAGGSGAASAPMTPSPVRGPEAFSSGGLTFRMAPIEDEALPFNLDGYETIVTAQRLSEWIAEARAPASSPSTPRPRASMPCAPALSASRLRLAPGRACYIPLAHGHAGGDLLSEQAPDQIPNEDAIRLLKPLLEDPAVLKVGQNIKYDLQVLWRSGIAVSPFDDTMLISFALAAGKHGHGMDELSEQHLGHVPIPFKEVAGTGKAQITFDQVPLDRATRYAAEDADVTLRLWRKLKPQLPAARVAAVYETMDRPLIAVTAAMEREGVLVDRDKLSQLSGEFAQRMAALEDEAKKLAGRDFNPGSPKQIGDILFGEMGLPGAKKTKTGAWATGADTLEDLAAEGHALPRTLLDWRMLSKLRSTYTETLREAINPTPAAFTPAIHWLAHRQVVSPRPIPTSRTFRSVRRKAARSARPSSRRLGMCWCLPTTRRSNCACWQRSRTWRSSGAPSSMVSTFTHLPPPKCSASPSRAWTR